MLRKLICKQTLFYAAPLLAALGLFVTTLIDRTLMGPFFIQSAFYANLAMIAAFGALHIEANQGVSRHSFVRRLKDNWIGLVISAVVSTVIIVSVEPSLRILADETNLLGVSKNLFFQRSATLTISGKWYYEEYWALNNIVERRPTLYPFFISILHFFRGYNVSNAFWVNAIVIPVFIFQTYRFAKTLGGETLGIAASLLVLAHPITLISARSGGFDFIAAFFLLLVLKAFLDHCRKPSPDTLAILWLNLCLTTHLRYEGMLTHLLATVALLALRLVRWSDIRPRLWLYVISPLFLLPRFWQAVVKANDTEQPLSASLFGIPNLFYNLFEYFQLLGTPLKFGRPHTPLILLLGTLGLAFIVRAVVHLYKTRTQSTGLVKFSLFATTWVVMVCLMSFSYVWGKSLHPSAARLFIVIDALFSLSAAYFITVILRRFPQWVTILTAGAFVFLAVPVASEARIINELTLPRQAAQCWRFFEGLKDKRIVIVTDRPGLYTVMNYGAVELATAKKDKSLLTELSRHLFQDVYVIQEIRFHTKAPTKETEIWPQVEKEPVLEFQNTESTFVRISRIKHKRSY